MVTGWQNLLENNGPSKSAAVTSELSASTIGISVGACFPLLHLHGATQVASVSELTHLAMRSTSSVISAGAQKSLSGIKAFPLLHTQVPVHSVALFGKQAAKSPSAVGLSTLTGWQNSFVNSGVSPDGVGGP